VAWWRTVVKAGILSGHGGGFQPGNQASTMHAWRGRAEVAAAAVATVASP
jgi:hypothetical protein